MRTLNFVIDGQKLKTDPSCDFTGIVLGTRNYLKASFTFSKDWAGFVKVAEFHIPGNDTYYPVPVINNECLVPKEVTDYLKWRVQIVGKKQSMKLTTNSCSVRQERR